MRFATFKNCENIHENVGAQENLTRDSFAIYASSPLYIRATCSP